VKLTRGFKFAPVAWATTVLTLLNAALAANEIFDVIPDRVMPYVLFADAALAALLGRAVYNRVTPVAAPHDDAGNPLVPAKVRSVS
jgi:hypothetical protein